MSTEPVFPAEAFGAPATAPTTAAPASTSPQMTGHPAPYDPASAAKTANWQRVGVGAAIGIGSAAVAAALLYASRGRKG